MFTENFNNNFYSRQIGTFGIDTMKKILKMNIFIYGMRGLGVEIAKNTILSGPKLVTIYDPNQSQINDLTANFYLTEEDVNNKKRRDEACLYKLSKLNPYVIVNIMEGENLINHIKETLSENDKKYDVIVISEFLPKKTIIEIDQICRQNKIGLIFACEVGIYGFCFVDFGDDHIIYDKNGIEPKTYLIDSITKEEKGKVIISDKSGNLQLTSKDQVIFKGIEGMTELNDNQPCKIKILNNKTIEIGDTSNFSDYISGGTMTNVKIPEKMKFDSFEERLEDPIKEGEPYPNPLDYLNVNLNEILHIGILSLFEFFDKNNYLPKINDENDSKILLEISKNIFKIKQENSYWAKNLAEITENFEEIFEKTIQHLSLWAKTEISSICSFLGGMVSQEIIKLTGKYKPIHQWVWLDYSEIVENLKNVDRELKNSRYDDQIAIFGNEIQEKLINTNIFMIGAGALGCEFLKIFALMGIATNNNYKITVTDNDNIELSNLNRQFLFDKDSIGQSKSKIACEKIKKINNSFNCENLQYLVNRETENIFDENFWKKQDYIILAVDNVEARKYIQEQCKIYNKILIDSGTTGTQANSQVIIPHKTNDYRAPQEKQDNIPVCTLKNFPYLISHCIVWSKETFNDYFVVILKELKMFIENKENYYKYLNNQGVPSDQIPKLKEVMKYSEIFLKKDFKACVKIALEKYTENFVNNILQLIYQFPHDCLDDKGKRFWRGSNKFPHPLPFDVSKEIDLLYIKKYVQILTKGLSIPNNENDEYLKKIISEIKIKEFVPIPVDKSVNNRYDFKNEEEKKKNKEERKKRFMLSMKELKNLKNEANKLNFTENDSKLIKIEDFDKDDDCHMDFIFSSSNLRAENYNIKTCDKHKIKIIAGKIIPAIASTTAAIVGMVALQIYTFKQTENIYYFRNCAFNFGINYISFQNLRSCDNIKVNENENSSIGEKAKFKLIPEKFTIWDYIQVNGSLTLKKFIEYIKEKYNVDLTFLSSNETILYSDSNNGEDNMEKKVENIYNEISEFKLIDNKKFLILNIEGYSDNFNIKMPCFKYYFKE